MFSLLNYYSVKAFCSFICMPVNEVMNLFDGKAFILIKETF